MTSYREIAETLRNPDGPYFAENTPAMLALEAMVDVVGLANVLYALEHICEAKSQHLQENLVTGVNLPTWQTYGKYTNGNYGAHALQFFTDNLD